MYKPKIEVLLNILRLYQMMQGFKCGPKPAVTNVYTDNNDGKNINGKKGLGGRKSVLGFTENQRL